MSDFTLIKYRTLLKSLIESGYAFQTVSEFIENPGNKVIMLRHDIDARKSHALEFASIQAELDIKGTYYFRIIKKVFDPELMINIEKLGHEIGYHYEDMDLMNGNIDLAYESAVKNLVKFREYVRIQSICMHGSPLSVYDNKEVWKIYNYKELGITSEPYFDIDFSEVLYLTDTGRMWNSTKSSIRDKVESGFDFNFHKTDEIIKAAESGFLPDKIMFNFHPQRWTDNPFIWTQELVTQNLKNVLKAVISNTRKS